MIVRPYTNLYLGLAPVLDTVSGADWVEMLHSFDGIQWQREPDRKPFLLGVEGQWDSPSIYFMAAAPILAKDKLLFYYGGTNMPHLANGKAFLGWLEGLRTHTPTPYVRSGPGNGSTGTIGGLCGKTGPRRVAHPAVSIERAGIDAQRRCRTGRGERRPGRRGRGANGGLTMQDAQPIRSNGLDLPLQWKGKHALDHLVGQTVRLRIAATNAALYGLGLAGDRKG